MAINSSEYKIECEQLDKTLNWISKTSEDAVLKVQNIKDKVAILKKESHGRYNEELETYEKLHKVMEKDLEKLKDSISSPYFGRIDFREEKRLEESFYIGKFSLTDLTSGEEVVIDWRAPIADLYYSGTGGRAYYVAPDGVISGELLLKRKFLIRNKVLIDAFDEGINEIIVNRENGNSLVDELLKLTLEESTGGKLKDVVATIQKEQNEIIRKDKNGALIVQGSAGSGKTTVALHRLAYLLYRYRQSITGKDILIIAPNNLFLNYIGEFLPDLGIEEVKQYTYETLIQRMLNTKYKIISKEEKLISILEGNQEEKYLRNTSKLKGSMQFKTMMDRFITHTILNASIDDIALENYVIFNRSELQRLFKVDLINRPVNARIEEIKRYLRTKLPDRIKAAQGKIDFTYEILIGSVKSKEEDGADRRIKLQELYNERDKKRIEIAADIEHAFHGYFEKWKIEDISKLYRTFYNSSDYEIYTGKRIPEALWKHMGEEYENRINHNIIDMEDLAPIMYLKLKLDGVPRGFEFMQVIIDEAQDYSYFEYYVLKHLSRQNSLTIVGDLGQSIYRFRAIDSWDTLMKEVFFNEGSYTTLTQSYRSTVEIIENANKVLKQQEFDLPPAVPVLRHGATPEFLTYTNKEEFLSNIVQIEKNTIQEGKSTIAVITKDSCGAETIYKWLKAKDKTWELIKNTNNKIKSQKIVISSYMTKGLEFDTTVVIAGDEFQNTEGDKALLYVALTRALHQEYILYKDKLTILMNKI